MTETPKTSWLSRLGAGLKKTATKLGAQINAALTHKTLDEATLESLEEALLSADIGPKGTERLLAPLRRTKFNQSITLEEIRDILSVEMINILEPVCQTLTIPKSSGTPYVILVIGVNGSGKTTTIAKLAEQYKAQGLKVRVAAADTFRAAAVEQLRVWANRVGVPMTSGAEGADSSSVAFEALEECRRQGEDLLLIDTAGRLHNNVNLMAELQKIKRVLQKLDPKAPQTCLMILDATLGQNAYTQCEVFTRDMGVDGLIITKLDGSAKGGVVLGLAATWGHPIYAIGVGETLEDLNPFSPESFATRLLGDVS